MAERGWEHDELAHDLAECRRAVGEIAAERLGLGSWGGREQLDVATMRTSWSTPRPTAYEVKVTRSDFLSDVRSEKYARYLPFVSRLFYATPSGLVDPKELPMGVGLIVRGPKGWSVRKAAPNHTVEPDKRLVFLTALLFKDQDAPWKMPSRAERVRLAAEGAPHELNRKGMERVCEALRSKRDLDRAREERDALDGIVRDAESALRRAGVPGWRLPELIENAVERLKLKSAA